MFRTSKRTEDIISMAAIYEELLNGSEDYLMKTMGTALGATGGSFPDSIDPEMVTVVNQALAYWKDSKKLMIQMAKIADSRHESLVKELDDQRKFLDQQASLLREQSCILKDIQDKLEVGSIIKSTKTKAE